MAVADADHAAISKTMSIEHGDKRITPARKRRLRARAHALKPVVIVGSSGIGGSLIAALEQALDDHGLIKIRINAEDRVTRRALIDELCVACRADLIQTIGHVAVLFREPENEALRAALS
jgi:RNA-binding protein